MTQPTRLEPDEENGRVIMPLRYGLCAVLTLRTPRKVAPPPRHDPPAEQDTGAEPLPFPESPPWGPIGFPDWYDGPR